MRGIFKSSGRKESSDLSWILLEKEEELNRLLSSTDSYFIFKHSYRCSISLMAKSRLDSSAWTGSVYLVDVVKHRQLSQAIAAHFQVKHESPQLLKISNSEVVGHWSHSLIKEDLLSD